MEIHTLVGAQTLLVYKTNSERAKEIMFYWHEITLTIDTFLFAIS